MYPLSAGQGRTGEPDLGLKRQVRASFPPDARSRSWRGMDAITLAGLETAVASESRVEVRIALTKAAIAWSKTSSDARRVVKWIAENEQEVSIQRAAAAALSV